MAGSFASALSHRRYSYAAVMAMLGVGLAFPAAVIVPLALGMVVLGVAHGACDQLVVPAGQPTGVAASGWSYWRQFLLGYLGLAAVVGVLWWFWPAATVAGFFLLTVWHWGSADAPTAEANVSAKWWLTHSLLRGLLIFAVPAWGRAAETLALVNELLSFVGAAAVPAPVFKAIGLVLEVVVVAGHPVLWTRYAMLGRKELLQADVMEVVLLSVLFVALPPRVSVAVYFVFWHSLQHILRLNNWLGYARHASARASGTELLAHLFFFLRRAAPLLLLSCVALLVLGHLLAPRLPTETAWFSLALVVASIVTLPHAMLVTAVMDAPRWQGFGSGSRK